jgi:hypothetical protein
MISRFILHLHDILKSGNDGLEIQPSRPLWVTGEEKFIEHDEEQGDE